MIHTNVNNSFEQQFIAILERAADSLIEAFTNSTLQLSDFSGRDFEPLALKHIQQAAENTVFANTFELVSGRAFPDIVSSHGGMGVEIKTSTKGYSWSSMGNSIMESSRLQAVKSIFIFFAVLKSNVEIRVRRYEDCLINVEVTHSPRYRVNMNTPIGETIFDKVGIPYDELRQLTNPFKPIADFHRKRLGDKGDVWWLNSSDADEDVDGNSVQHISILYWSGLPRQKKEVLRAQMLALFPELFSPGGPGSNKYNRPASWLLQRHKIICPAFRDIFSGGGKSSVVVGGVKYESVPTFIKKRLLGKIGTILSELRKLDMSDLQFYWDKPLVKRDAVEEYWKQRVLRDAQEWLNGSDLTAADLFHNENIILPRKLSER
tara:strand:+ start:345 stop:1472 length:1128 start_codon:yes stop_codon:yes gene_type:complete